MTAPQIQLFDNRGHLRPLQEIEPQIAALGDPVHAANFAAVVTAAGASEAATAARGAAEARVTAAIKAVADAERALRESNPNETPLQAARAWIATQKAHRQ